MVEIPTGLTFDEQLAWAQANMTPEELAKWSLSVRQRNLMKNKKIRPTKQTKHRILVDQGEQCAFCQSPIAENQRFCFDKHTATVVCLVCNMYLVAWRKARASGITEDMTVEFNER